MKTILAFLVIINPIALYFYLEPVIKELNTRDFLKVLLKASLISFVILATFILSGNFLFEEIFQINFESFRIFGGIIIFTYAYFFIVKGHTAIFQIKEDLDDLASEIALPFFVGAGTISLTIVLGREQETLMALIILLIILVINFFTISGLGFIKERLLSRRMKIAFDKNMGILLRLNGFFLGAIGIDMTLTGFNNLYSL